MHISLTLVYYYVSRLSKRFKVKFDKNIRICNTFIVFYQVLFTKGVKMINCSKCGSLNVSCNSEYFTTGGDMESVEWKHTCADCGEEKSETQTSCYGQDNHYCCPFPGCEKTYDS